MLEKDFAIIAVRLLALYIIVMTANALPRYLGMIGSKIGMDPESKCIFAFEHYWNGIAYYRGFLVSARVKRNCRCCMSHLGKGETI